MTLIPRKPVPPIEVDTLGGKHWTLSSQYPVRFSIVVFYRGLHCPVCLTYIGELDRLQDEFVKRGVSVIALRTDTRERAEETAFGSSRKGANALHARSIGPTSSRPIFSL